MHYVLRHYNIGPGASPREALRQSQAPPPQNFKKERKCLHLFSLLLLLEKCRCNTYIFNIKGVYLNLPINIIRIDELILFNIYEIDT